MEKINAPFTKDQVEELNKHQNNYMFHPYTCGGCEPSRVLHVTIDGLKCCYCGHDQKWAWTTTKQEPYAKSRL